MTAFPFNYLPSIYLIILKNVAGSRQGHDRVKSVSVSSRLQILLIITTKRVCFSDDTSPDDSRSFSSSPLPGLMLGTMIRSRRINVSSAARLRFQLSAHKLDLRNDMELPYQFLKLSLSQFRLLFHVISRTRCRVNWRKFFFFFFCVRVGATSLHSFSRASFVACFTRFALFSSILRQSSSFFFLLFYIYMKKYIS